MFLIIRLNLNLFFIRVDLFQLYSQPCSIDLILLIDVGKLDQGDKSNILFLSVAKNFFYIDEDLPKKKKKACVTRIFTINPFIKYLSMLESFLCPRISFIVLSEKCLAFDIHSALNPRAATLCQALWSLIQYI